MTLLLAGHETTALALTYTLSLLATNPEQADRLRTELDEKVNGNSLSRDDIEDLTYTKRTIREGMRIYPPVQSLERETTEPIELGGYAFSEGTSVTVQQWVLHHDSRFYEDPDVFRPERWSKEFRDSLPRFDTSPLAVGHDGVSVRTSPNRKRGWHLPRLHRIGSSKL